MPGPASSRARTTTSQTADAPIPRTRCSTASSGAADTITSDRPSSHSGCTTSRPNAVATSGGALNSSSDSGTANHAVTRASTGRMSQLNLPARYAP
ncbi:hypothetical protein ACFQV2_07135 [Actinokineospora soli]|uniref:Uncharacterized protein n=1 Tax=Actinokineospora soli TaxID=1048753 RepID=A0ABW2TIT5_9PSEU